MSMNTPFHLRQREFNAFNSENPKVWEYFERFTLEAINDEPWHGDMPL